MSLKKYLKRISTKEEVPRNTSILVADDDVAIRTILYNVLKKEFDVTTVGSGLEALAWLSEGNQPDLIVSDLNMPRLGGITLLKTLSQSGLHNAIPVIILSGHHEEEMKTQLTEYDNLKAYLTKPFNPILIGIAIKNIIREKKAEGIPAESKTRSVWKQATKA